MKTIIYQGTREQIAKMRTFVFTDGSNDRLPQEVETRVYVVDTHKVYNKSHADLTDEEFIKLAKEDNEELSLSTFQKHFNIGEYDEPHYVIRFIDVPVF